MDKKRFRPGDMARIIYARDVSLIGQIVVVEEWLPAYQRWGVMLLGRSVAGVTLGTCEFKVTRHSAARDSSLEPLRGMSHGLAAVSAEARYGN